MSRLAVILATWFGCGYWPKGPGTAGSIAALLVAWPLIAWLHLAPWHFAVLALLMTPVGIWSAGRTAELRGAKDPQMVVIDEVLGQWLTLAGAPALNWKSMLAALALFRLFDILKPWPVRRLESIPGGAGIVLDDLGAGVLGALVLSLAGWFNLI